MVEVDPIRVPTSGNLTPATIAPHDQAPHRRRNVLGRARDSFLLRGSRRRRAQIDGLRIAARSFERGGIDCERFTAALLGRAPAIRTLHDRDLIWTATLVAGT